MAVEPQLLGTRLAASRPESAEAHLSRYLPRCIHAQLGQSRPGQRRPGVSRFDGVVLLTDLAGFSRMTDQFSAQGPEGVERLSHALDAYFGSMTEIALDHGGDVVDFVGDAIVVMWAGGEDLGAATAAAVSCGLALQAALKEVAQATGLSLQQRVSISAGELLQFILGGTEGKWRWLLAGAPMAQAGACNHLARPGQVLVCDSAWALVRERCRGQLLDSGHAVAERVVLPAAPQRIALPRDAGETLAQLEEFVARPLLERFRAGHWDWLGEFRTISAVFIGLPQLDLTAPGAPEQAQQATACAQREFAHYGGSLQSLSMDDKGITLFAAFGLPGHTHEDDCVRAVRAALALESWLKDRGIACSAGITHGRAFYGDSGGLRRRRVTLIGGVVNLAARLMQTAPGGVLCDEATRQRAARVLSFSPAPAQRVKNQAEPVPVYTPHAADESSPWTHDNALIGRAPERRRVGEALDRLVAGDSGLLLLCGEAGIGKSRLLRDSVRQARRRVLRVLASPCSSIEAATPYFAWRRLLQQMLLGERPFDAAAARAALAQRLKGEAQLEPWQPLLNDILPLQLEENDITRQMESGARASGLRAVLLHLLRGLAAERPVVLVVDDLHWCDDASAIILAEAVDAVPRLLLLAGTRPLHRGAAEGAVQLLRKAAAHTLLLDLLPREELDQLARHRLGVQELPRELCEFLYSRTGGNPFYGEELLLALRGAGLVELAGGQCRLSPEFGRAGPATLPNTLQGVIISRVDQLGPAEQLTLKLISVIGREFSLAMLRRLHPVAVDAEALEAILAALLQADVVRPATTGVAGEFAFKHAILREVIYDLLPYAQRRQFHRDIALWIESQGSAQLEPHYAELALHWEKAGEVDKAITYLERAGTLAFGRFANRLAIQHIRKAYSLAQRHDIPLGEARVAACEGILGDSHQELFEYDTAALHFKRCLNHLGLPAAETPLRLSGGLLRELLLQLRLRLGRGGKPTPDPRVRRAAHIYQRLAESSFFDNRPLQLLHQILASINLAERSGATREIVDGFGAIAVVAVAAGLRRASHYYNRRSMEITREASPADAAYGYLVDMVYWATLGGWGRLDDSRVSGEAIYRQLGGAVRWQQTQSVTYTALIVQGRYDDALGVMQQARAAMPADVPAQVLSFWYCSMLDIALVRGLPLEPLIAGLEAAQEPGLHRSDRMRSLGLIARARQLQGQRGLALVLAERALEVIRQSMPTPWHIGDGIAAAAEVYMDEWEAEHADPRLLQRAAEVCKALRGFARRVPSGLALAALVNGRYRELRGERRAALKWWRIALQAAQQLGAEHDRGRALYRLGLALPPAEGRPLLDQALAAFRGIGADGDAALCAAALAQRGAAAAA
jgi:adenylate cyclase